MDAVDQPPRQLPSKFLEGRGGEGWGGAIAPTGRGCLVDASRKRYGIIRVSAIAILLDAARNLFTVSLSARDKTLRPVSVYKRSYSVRLLDATDTGRR